MNISTAFCPNFNSRQLSLSQARAMKLRVGEMFPYTSNWKLAHVDYYDILKHHNISRGSTDDAIRNVNNEIKILNDLTKNASQALRLVRNEYTQFVKEPLEYFKKLASGILKYKVANCGEIARLMYMAARINDVDEKDVSVSKLAYREQKFSQLGYPLPFNEVDHVILTMNGETEPVGIDGILDETESIEDLKRVYSQKYGKTFRIPKNAEVEFLPVKRDITSARTIPQLNDSDAENLRAMFPDLVV